jgi:hypothetical protein
VTSAELEPRAGAVPRAIAFIGAVLVGLIATAISVGFALAAPLGMWYGAALARRRGHTFTRGATWVSAVAGVLVAIGLGLGALTVHDPGMWRPIFSVADSTTSRPTAYVALMAAVLTYIGRCGAPLARHASQ